MLRRQVIRPLRKPLVVMTPKSLLRHKLAISTLEDLANGSFQTVIPEIDSLDPKKVDRVVLCSGKVYYDLLEKRRAEGREDTAIVRIEQLYPFPEDDLAEVLAPYKNLKHIVWCQEEQMCIRDRPWPVTGRDVVIHVTTEKTADGTVIRHLKADPTYIPEEKGQIRVPKLVGEWKLQPKGQGVTCLLYTSQGWSPRSWCWWTSPTGWRKTGKTACAMCSDRARPCMALPLIHI